MFGAGVPEGLVLGRTDAGGHAPTDRPVTPNDLASAVYHKLGFDPTPNMKRPTAGPSGSSIFRPAAGTTLISGPHLIPEIILVSVLIIAEVVSVISLSHDRCKKAKRGPVRDRPSLW